MNQQQALAQGPGRALILVRLATTSYLATRYWSDAFITERGPGLAEDPRFRTNSDRVVNRRALITILSDLFATEPIAAWAKRLDAAGIPNGPIQTIDQVVADAQTTALGIIQRWGSISLVGLPLSFDGARPPLAKLAPRLGEDNPEIVDPAT